MDSSGSDSSPEKQTFTPRRTQRQTKLSLKAQESLYYTVLKNARLSEESSEEEATERPAILHDNETVQGEKIFKFQSRKTRNSLLHKASEVRLESLAQTPTAVRQKIKKSVAKEILEENSSDSEHDFSDSGSEYTDSSESISDSNSSPEVQTRSRSKQEINIQPRKARQYKNHKYVIKAEDYFANHASKKIVTSNHTLDKLETPRLPQDQLQKLLESCQLSGEHQKSVLQLENSSQLSFSKWLCFLHENFNILLYGLGSKRRLLDCFHQKFLRDSPVIVVNGFFPSLTVKDILDGIIVDLLELKENPANVYEACDLIEQEFKFIPESRLYIIVHNIDMIRIGKAQNVLAKLAAIDNVHLVASIDHINAPLIWDHSKLSKFNFAWWDVTSFQPYTDETSFESSMMVQQSGTLALSSLRNVFLSLTNNSKGIYLLVVRHQLENSKNQYYQGLAFKDLYSACREAFLVSSDLALRAQLTEFVDHKMIKFKRSVDGTEYLVIPISNNLLQQFLIEQK